MHAVVDNNDLVLWEAAYGVGNGANADGDVDSDGGDFLTWQVQHGSGVPLTGSTIAVPEPPAAVLIFIAALALPHAKARREMLL